MLIALFVVAVLVFTYLGVRAGRLSGRSCCSGPWPPDDLSGSEPRWSDPPADKLAGTSAH